MEEVRVHPIKGAEMFVVETGLAEVTSVGNQDYPRK